MGLIRLKSEARKASQWNTSTITFNAGKPATIIAAECDGLRERREGEMVHLATDGVFCNRCVAIGPMVWTDSEELWERNAARCGQEG